MQHVTHLCLVRHGETAWNAEGRLQGHTDIALNAHGLAQAQNASAALADTPFAAIYCSDLQRAHRTAQVIATRHTESPLTLDPGLRERHFGAFQGLTWAEAAQQFPAEHPRLRAREIDLAPPGGGESLQRFAHRVLSTLEALARQHAGQTILIVSHGGCLDVIYRAATGMSLEATRNFALGNATLNWVDYHCGGWQLVRWNDAGHLTSTGEEVSA